jgi:hypothetical protein
MAAFRLLGLLALGLVGCEAGPWVNTSNQDGHGAGAADDGEAQKPVVRRLALEFGSRQGGLDVKLERPDFFDRRLTTGDQVVLRHSGETSPKVARVRVLISFKGFVDGRRSQIVFNGKVLHEESVDLTKKYESETITIPSGARKLHIVLLDGRSGASYYEREFTVGPAWSYIRYNQALVVTQNGKLAVTPKFEPIRRGDGFQLHQDLGPPHVPPPALEQQVEMKVLDRHDQLVAPAERPYEIELDFRRLRGWYASETIVVPRSAARLDVLITNKVTGEELFKQRYPVEDAEP